MKLTKTVTEMKQMKSELIIMDHFPLLFPVFSKVCFSTSRADANTARVRDLFLLWRKNILVCALHTVGADKAELCCLCLHISSPSGADHIP